MACSCSCSLQYSSGSIDYPNLSGCQLPDVDYQDNTYQWISTSGTTGTSPLSVQWLTSWWVRVCSGAISQPSSATSIRLVCADLTADRFQKYYDLDGISIPQPFCQSFMPFAIVFNKLFDMIPGSLSSISMQRDWRRSLVCSVSHWYSVLS